MTVPTYTYKGIDPLRYYDLSELVRMGQKGYIPIKTKVTLLRLITKGKLPAVNVSSTEKAVYTIKGEHLIAFLSSYETQAFSQNKATPVPDRKTKPREAKLQEEVQTRDQEEEHLG